MNIAENHTGIPEIVLALSQPASLKLLQDQQRPLMLSNCLKQLGCPQENIRSRNRDRPVSRIYLGNEFCERLMPGPKDLEYVQSGPVQRGINLTLVTPMLTDAGFRRLDNLLPYLSAGTEVVINDWGALHRLRADYPSLVPVLGRMLNKMIKDPRLPSAQWTRLQPHSSQSAHFQAFLERFGISQIDMDVPPFAGSGQFQTAPLRLGVHLPYGYTVKGRMCRIGSLGQKDQEKFVAGHACHKECLAYWAKAKRSGQKSGQKPETELYSFQRGNSQFYRHSEEMAAAMWQAVDNGWINRLIFAGDWHENYRPAE